MIRKSKIDIFTKVGRLKPMQFWIHLQYFHIHFGEIELICGLINDK